LQTLDAVQELADRIERAYLRRRPTWHRGLAHPRVWSAAAETLVELHAVDSWTPVDPELFVASQPIRGDADPWRELTGAEPARRYGRRVRQVVRLLEVEIRGEVRRGELLLGSDRPVEHVLRSCRPRLSPLARYLVAHRAGRPELAEAWRGRAAQQHRACPLYRQACRRLLPVGAYPDSPASAWTAGHTPRFSVN